MLAKCDPILHPGARLEISQQFRPVVLVRLPEQFDEPLALPAGGRLLKRHLKEDGIPPADLIVAVITDHTRLVAQRENLVARHLVHAVDDLRVPHVPPGRAGSRSDMQHGRERQICVTATSQCLEIAPSADSSKSPGLEPLHSGVGPQVRISVMLPCCIGRIGGIELSARSALVDTTHPEGKEPLSAGPDEPGRLVLLLN